MKTIFHGVFMYKQSGIATVINSAFAKLLQDIDNDRYALAGYNATPEMFQDVKEDYWYVEEVKNKLLSMYDKGLIK
jgi:hypothetical protein